MLELQLAIGILVMFFLRIGLPLLLLIILGTLIDRWQTKREQDIRMRYGTQEKERAAA